MKKTNKKDKKMPSEFYNRNPLKEETKIKIGLSNKKKMKEYWKNNKPTEKQLKFRERRTKELENSRCKNCGVIIGKNKIHSCEEQREKNRLSHIGLKKSEEQKRKIKESNLGKHYHKVSEEGKKRISSALQKIDIKDWCGFKEKENKRIRKSKMLKIWREAVFLRDNFTCQNKNCPYCNNKQGGKLNAHHIKSFALYPELRFEISNGITYCEEYHIKSNLHKFMQKES